MKSSKYFIVFLFALSVITSCTEVQTVNLKDSKLNLSVSNNYYNLTELNLLNNQLVIEGMLDPGKFTGEITLKITTKADPAGIEIKQTLNQDSYTSGSYEYMFNGFTENVQVCSFTNATQKQIKVSSGSDVITVKILNSDITSTYSVNTSEALDITYWSGNTTGTLWVYGYSYTGTENLEINVWSDIDANKIKIPGQYTNYTEKEPFPSYQFDMKFITGVSDQNSKSIAVDQSKKTNLYFEYKGKTYKSELGSELSTPLPTN